MGARLCTRVIVRPMRRGDWTNRRSRRISPICDEIPDWAQLAKIRPCLASFLPRVIPIVAPRGHLLHSELEGPMQQTIALVDDDQNILTSVSMALEAEGFRVHIYKDGEDAFRGLSREPVDLAVLDIKMPRMDGVELLQKLRRSSEIPVIFLTSKDDEVDEMLGLRMGADDYIKKPFSQRLLIERIRTLLRRLGHANGNDQKSEGTLLRGDLVLDSDRHLCTWQTDEVPLTVTEFLLIRSLAQRPGHVKTRDQLMDAAYGESIYVDDRTIDSHIKRLRAKFRQVDSDFAQIETLYGVGYRYRDS